jgi:hypothetical protein
MPIITLIYLVAWFRLVAKPLCYEKDDLNPSTDQLHQAPTFSLSN